VGFRVLPLFERASHRPKVSLQWLSGTRRKHKQLRQLLRGTSDFGREHLGGCKGPAVPSKRLEVTPPLIECRKADVDDRQQRVVTTGSSIAADNVLQTASSNCRAWLTAASTGFLRATPAPQIPDTSSARIGVLESQIRVLQAEVNSNRMDYTSDRERYSRATLDPTEPSFQRVDAMGSFGSFAVSIEDVRPFGDGVRLRMHLGNLSTAAFDGVIVKIQYGAREPKDYGAADWESREKAWKDSLQKKEVTLTDTLRPGHWNPVEITIPGIAVDRLGYLEVRLQTNDISLAK
jgi:hypothetical protein